MSDQPQLSNAYISVRIDPQTGRYHIHDAKTRQPLLIEAQLGETGAYAPSQWEILSTTSIEDQFGPGRRLVVAASHCELFDHDHQPIGKQPPRPLYSLTVYDQHPALVLGFGLKTPHFYSRRLTGGCVLRGGSLFGGQTMVDPQTLNGGAGSEPTSVSAGLNRTGYNSLLLTGQVNGERRSVVWGGLRHEAFGKYARLTEGKAELFAEDPIGVLVDEEQEYFPTDTFYIDVSTAEPFEALERYGQAMRLANHAAPQVYDFPVLCGWSVGAISKLPNVNNSARLVEEADHANACGMTRYTPVALRLEPDKYHDDTEQGWWDDAHFREHGHLVEPYQTLNKWCAALFERRCVPYIYMQLGMPSDDFARAFPQYMLFNDASEVDRQASKSPEGRKHNHHMPFVTYDYTDAEFAEHFVKAWSRIRQAGVRGVKIDYPATAWRPEGGFDDRYASTNAAYRRAFELMRRAMGDDGLIDERNLGESAKPRLDVTAGLVDTQRTWGDSNQFVPEMISRSGLRWYKNRVVFNYYSDTKAVHDLPEPVVQALITMNFLTSGRLDLATSFSFFTPQITRIVSRSYPHYAEAKTARPLDAFTGVADPQVYHLELNDGWHQISLYNTGESRATIGTALSGDRIDNAIALPADRQYHAYAFWTDQYLGQRTGGDRIEMALDPNHCEMIALRKVEPHPQVISTDRHLLQGWVDLADVQWDAPTRTLSGIARVVEGEPFTITVANNSYCPDQATADEAQITREDRSNTDLCYLQITSPTSRDVRWMVVYKPSRPSDAGPA